MITPLMTPRGPTDPGRDSLEACLLFLCAHFELPASASVVRAELVGEERKLDLDDFLSAAGRVGLSAEVVQTSLDRLHPAALPMVALLKDGRAVSLAREFHQSGRTVAAICAAPLILKEAGILEGRAFTAHFSVHGELPGVTDNRVVADGPVVTSRGPGTAVDFGLALVKLLAGDQVASEVAAGIMA